MLKKKALNIFKIFNHPLFQFKDLPVYDFKLILLLISLANFIFSYFWEVILLQNLIYKFEIFNFLWGQGDVACKADGDDSRDGFEIQKSEKYHCKEDWTQLKRDNDFSSNQKLVTLNSLQKTN